MIRWLPMTALSALLVAPAQGQAPAPPASAPAEDKADVTKSILEQELEPAPGGYSYNSQGRRDPFVSLLKPVAADRGPKTRKPGMEGFLIQEIALRGIVRTGGGGTGVGAKPGFVATFQGTDGKSYFVREGQRLYDGVILTINANSVTFRQEVTDPLSPVRTRELRKTLDASEEARQ
jgi:hypothetical protein